MTDAQAGRPVPTDGWELLRVEDVGSVAGAECTFCHNERVRFVHVLRHRGWPGTIRVGSVCAGRLTGDADQTERAEAAARGEARRFDTWLRSDKWTREADYHARDGRHLHWDYTLVVHRAGDGWRWTLHLGPDAIEGGHASETADEAKRAAWRQVLA